MLHMLKLLQWFSKSKDGCSTENADCRSHTTYISAFNCYAKHVVVMTLWEKQVEITKSECVYDATRKAKKPHTHKTHRKHSVPHWPTHQLWGSGVSCWWRAREKPKKVPWSPNLCSVWVVSRLKPHTWVKRVNRAHRRVVVQGWEEQDEGETVFPCPTGAAIARCRGKFSSRGAQGRFLFWLPESKVRQENETNPV